MSSRKPLAAINITPLVDVLLILLVILMLAMPLFAKRMPVDLPKTSLDASPSVKNTLKVAIKTNGELFLNDTPLSKKALLDTVGESSSVELYADGKVSYETLAKLISDIQERNPQGIALMSQ